MCDDTPGVLHPSGEELVLDRSEMDFLATDENLALAQIDFQSSDQQLRGA